MQNQKNVGKNLSIRVILGVMIAVMLVSCVLLLVATYSMATGNVKLNSNIRKYAQWQAYANELQSGSDFLTEQVRCFVVTGDRAYLDEYFKEATVTRSRDKAVEGVKKLVGENRAYRSLVDALGESVNLMNREYYAMRLTVDAHGYKLSAFPEEIRTVYLSEKDAEASAEKQKEIARRMVFDDIYHDKKKAISGNIQKCLDAMDTEIEEGQTAAQKEMDRNLMLQRIMIIIVILSFIASFLLFLFLVVTPLLQAVTYIKKDQNIPITGSKEFQFLAREYNIMHDMNREQKEELAYEATHDKLTGVYNRNGYDSIRQNINWDTSALVLFDLDQFKTINDTYGHNTGDRVLARAARVIQNAFRAQDYVCRIGGDEFAVIMMQVRLDSGRLIEEKVAGINEELKEPEDDIPGIQTSCGVAYGAFISDYDKLFYEADAALYRVKGNGGGGCEVCE